MMAETAERVYTLQSSAVFDTRIFVLCGHGGMVAQDPALVGGIQNYLWFLQNQLWDGIVGYSIKKW